jgi:hypothetical protein
MSDREDRQDRRVALQAAATVRNLNEDRPEHVIRTAELFLQWLRPKGALVLSVSPIAYTQGKSESNPTVKLGEKVQLTDTQEVVLSVEAEDSKGNEVPDTLSWSESSGGATVTLQPSADTMSCTVVANEPGLGAVVTVTDGANLSATMSFDVVGGAAATLNITAGDPTEQSTGAAS